MFSFKTFFVLLGAVFTLSAGLTAQSTDQNFPSPVTQSEVGSTIRARDIGDARLTTHYWVFDGAQGDIFINVMTQNFSGDIDVYQASDLKPLTKMVMFADAGASETGRVIYMRQPGRLMLRVQGRTPNDDPASYKIKFAGSFVALAPQKEQKPPTVEGTDETGINVNSVGTILPVKPKPTAEAKPEKKVPARTETAATSPQTPPAKRAETKEQAAAPEKDTPEKDDPSVETIFGNKAAKVTVTRTPPETANPPTRRTATVSRPPKTRPEPVKDPLAGVSLVVTLKDGTRNELPMTDIIRFVYDHGFLTIFMKDGSIKRVGVAELASVTVQ